jgi:hypothetical protein
MTLADGLVIAGLFVWTALSILRFVRMYDPASPLQRWRRWDLFRLVPVGAFFSPSVPRTEHRLLVRDFLADGRVTPWTETPRIRPRRWWHAVWNPQKPIYRAKTECARSLIAAARHAGASGTEGIPPELALSDAYVALLRYAAAVQRPAPPLATQFAVLELDVTTRQVVSRVVSAVHQV